MLTFALCVLSITGAVAKATNQTALTPGERHVNHYLDVRERLDHLEDKLDAAACKLDKRQTEIQEKMGAKQERLELKLENIGSGLGSKLERLELKLEQVGSQLHSHESLMDAKLETLQLRLEKSLTSQMRDHMDRTLSMIRPLQADRPNTGQDLVNKNVPGAKAETNGHSLNQNETRTPYCSVDPALENQIENLTRRTDVCIRAAEVVSGRDSTPASRQRSPHEWITILRRITGRVNFSRDWDEYKSGFGDLGGEFWLGLEDIYQLTSRRSHRLRVVLTDFSGEVKFAEYSEFYIQGEALNYRLHVSGYVTGSTAGDGLTYHNVMDFSTLDRDNDKDNGKCAANQRGGWWYNACYHGNLMGQYLPAGDRSSNGIYWYKAYNDARSFKAAEMSIREE